MTHKGLKSYGDLPYSCSIHFGTPADSHGPGKRSGNRNAVAPAGLHNGEGVENGHNCPGFRNLCDIRRHVSTILDP